MSQLEIRESSEPKCSSGTDDFADGKHCIKKMIESSNKVDRRFVDLYKVRKARQLGVDIQFNLK